MNIYKKCIITSIIIAATYIGIRLVLNRIHLTNHTQNIPVIEISKEDLAQLINAGFALAEQGNYDAAIEHFKKALASSLLTDEGHTKLVTALGDAYFSKAYTNETEPNRAEDWQRSVNYFQQALSMKELPAQTRAFTEAKLGSMYLQPVNDIAPDEQKALKHLQRSLTIAELLPPERAITLTNLGTVYQNRVNDAINRDKALEYYQEAVQIATELGAQNLLALLENRIATLKK